MKLRRSKTAAIALALALLACCVCAFAGCSQQTTASSANTASSKAGSTASAASENASSASEAPSSAAAAEGDYTSGIHHAELTVEGYDPIAIELDADSAPLTVANFCTLADGGYYDGLTFYRFVNKFCMQGGTKGNTSSSNDSSLKPIAGEFSQNGYDNALADDFKKGTVAMARTSDPNSATSTFFITLDTSEGVSLSLNGQYAAFGTIDEAGMDIVDQIVADYLPNVTDAQMGVIADEAKQAKISSLKIVD